MDVPFSSSGALSRRHYALIRSVESAATVQEVDKYLMAEIQSMRSSLTSRNLTPALCKEYLVILLYCFNTIEHGFTSGLLDFALPHAVTLAETGKTIEQKRIGYLFCSELMQSDNELQLMLVNTVRKDLDNSSIARICLALEGVIALPSQYLAPAVHTRVQELLSHNSPQIRRRAIHACRILSERESNILVSTFEVLLKRLNDPDNVVINAALSAISSPTFRDSLGAQQLFAIKAVIQGLAFNEVNEGQLYHQRALLTLSAIGPLDEDKIAPLSEYAHHSAKTRHLSMLWTSFHLLSRYPIEQLKANFDKSPISYIRDLLAAEDPNLHYLFLTCLGSIDAVFWAGSTETLQTVLEASEVEKIMQFIDSPDSCIRIKTLQVLMAVDPNILDTVYARLLQALSHETNIKKRDEYITRLLEVVNTKTADNGELYAQMVMELLSSSDGALDMTPISEAAIEKILSHLHSPLIAGPAFQVNCAAALIASVAEEQLKLGPTVMVVISALVTQHSKYIPISLSAMLSGLASRLPGTPRTSKASIPSSAHLLPAPVQDACILTMLWLSADCEVASDEGRYFVNDTRVNYLTTPTKRCNQFRSLFQEKTILHNIIKASHSNTLPDFLMSLESYESEIAQGIKPEPHSSAIKSNELHDSKLRYDAYDAPHSTPKLRVLKHAQRWASPATESNSLVMSATPDTQGVCDQTNEPLLMMSDPAPRVDLIAFDQPSSPLVSESTFMSVWNSMENSDCNMRGWSDKTVPDLIRKLEMNENMTFEMIPEDEQPFYGEAKLMITIGQEEIVALKLRKSEEDGTLWRLRSERAELRERLKVVLT
ncbi:Armadillo-type fold [Amanita muscaria]